MRSPFPVGNGPLVSCSRFENLYAMLYVRCLFFRYTEAETLVIEGP
jgi:hypothetical protein